jgi:hypothetical protein
VENTDASKRGSLFKFEAWISLVLLVVTLWSFTSTTSDQLSGAEGERLAPIKFFMLFMACISFLFFLLKKKNENNWFLRFGFYYVLVGMFSSLICGEYSAKALPFTFISLSYWLWVLIISYYSVLHLNTLKFHVFIVCVFLPVLFFFFLTARNAYQRYSYDALVLNPVFYISFLLPTILLIRKNSLKISGVLLIFAAILISLKRSSFVAFVSAIPVFLYARNIISTSGKLQKLTKICFGGAFLVLLLAFTFNYVADTLNLDWTRRLGGIASDKGSGRLDIYNDYIDLLDTQSFFQWIIGGGPNATSRSSIGKYAHNDIIEVLYSFGLIGLMFYFLFVGQLAKIFFEMKKYKYTHFDAFAVSLVVFFWGSMISITITLPYWFLHLAFFWGWVVADFHNAKRFGDPARIANPKYQTVKLKKD